VRTQVSRLERFRPDNTAPRAVRKKERLVGWFTKDRVSLDDALRQLIRGVLSQDVDLAGFSTKKLSERELDVIQVCIGEYILSMVFNQLMERTGLSEEDLERHLESAGALAYKDLNESAPENSVAVLLSMKDYYLHDLPAKREQYLATTLKRYEKYGPEKINLGTFRSEIEELNPSFFYHQAFAHMCVSDFNPEDVQQQTVFDLCVRIAKQMEKRAHESLDIMFKKVNIVT
jgi:hypothetical protein